MEATRSINLTVILVLALGISVFPAYALGASSGTGTPGEGSCAECHAGPAGDIKAAGGRHRNVPCVGCHLGQHGTSEQRIQKCNRCHRQTKRAHFRLENCLGCHKNPHTPLNISFADIKGACVACHSEQVAQLRDNKSRHSAIECSSCHDVHRKVPECTRCHKPHAAEMAASECTKCHKAHMPKLVTYADDVPSRDCAACHGRAFDLLTAGKTKHEALACAFCHRQRHKMVPSCQGCHGSPHPGGIMAKFSKCDDCHKIAHDLNNWPDKRQKSAQNEARVEGAKHSVR
jgi:hypothetical protein